MSIIRKTAYRVITITRDGDYKTFSCKQFKDNESAINRVRHNMQMKFRGIVSSEIYPITFIRNGDDYTIEYRKFCIRVIGNSAYVYMENSDICQAQISSGSTDVINTVDAIAYIDKYWFDTENAQENLL